LLSVGPFGLGQNGVMSGRFHPEIAVGWVKVVDSPRPGRKASVEDLKFPRFPE